MQIEAYARLISEIQSVPMSRQSSLASSAVKDYPGIPADFGEAYEAADGVLNEQREEQSAFAVPSRPNEDIHEVAPFKSFDEVSEFKIDEKVK